MEQQIVKFRYGTPVTDTVPVIIPGSFVFDAATWALYLDTEEGRKRVTDTTKLSITGGTVTGTIEVIDSTGATRISFVPSGVITGQYLHLKGSIGLDPSGTYKYVAVIDQEDSVKGVTLDRMREDLQVPDIIASRIEETLFVYK